MAHCQWGRTQPKSLSPHSLTPSPQHRSRTFNTRSLPCSISDLCLCAVYKWSYCYLPVILLFTSDVYQWCLPVMFTSVVYQWYCLPVILFTSDVYQWFYCLPVLFTSDVYKHLCCVCCYTRFPNASLSKYSSYEETSVCNWSFSCNNNCLLWHVNVLYFAWKFKVYLINFFTFRILPREDSTFSLAVDQLAGTGTNWTESTQCVRRWVEKWWLARHL